MGFQFGKTMDVGTPKILNVVDEYSRKNCEAKYNALQGKKLTSRMGRYQTKFI